MSDYTDFWKSLDLPADQSPKTQAFNTVAANADKLSLTDAEQYSMGWGADAVPEDWVKARAKEINDEIQGAKSTAILRGDKTLAEMTPDEAAKEIEKVQSELGIGSSGGSGNGGNTSTSPSAPDNSIPSNASIDMATALQTDPGFVSALFGPAVGVLTKIGSKAYRDMASEKMGISSDKMNAQTALGSMADTGIGIKSDETGTVSTYSNPTTIAAQDKAVNDSIAADNAAKAAANSSSGSGGSYGSNYGGNVGSGGVTGGGSQASFGSGSVQGSPGNLGSRNSSSGSSSRSGGNASSSSGNTSNGSDGGRCVDPSTLITLADGSQRRAGDLLAGDLLHTMHEGTGEFGDYPVMVTSLVQQPRRLVRFEDGIEIIASDSHKFFMDDKTWKQVHDLAPGDSVQGLRGNSVVAGTHVIGRGDVIKLTVQDAHTYISAGLISHNKND